VKQSQGRKRCTPEPLDTKGLKAAAPGPWLASRTPAIILPQFPLAESPPLVPSLPGRLALQADDRMQLAYHELMTRKRHRGLVDGHHGADPLLRALAAAPLDDEPSGDDEDACVAEALAAYRRGEAIPSEQLRAKLGVDRSSADGHYDFQR
jgi:hypothetical protein